MATTAQEDRFRRFVLNNKDIGFERMMQIIREEQERGRPNPPPVDVVFMAASNTEPLPKATLAPVERVSTVWIEGYREEHVLHETVIEIPRHETVIDLTGIGVHYVGPLPNYKAGQHVKLKHIGSSPYRIEKRFIRDGQYWYRIEGRRFPCSDTRTDRMTDEVTEDKIAGLYEFAHQPVNLK